MNRAQKNTWFGLANCFIAVFFFVELFLGRVCGVPASSHRLASQPTQIEMLFRTLLHLWPLALPAIALVLLFFPRKKQSPAEPDFDELDSVVQNKATRISFISVWMLWLLALVLTSLKIGITGTIPAIFYFYVHLGVFLTCMVIYFLTKIILYRKQTEGGLS